MRPPQPWGSLSHVRTHHKQVSVAQQVQSIVEQCQGAADPYLLCQKGLQLSHGQQRCSRLLCCQVSQIEPCRLCPGTSRTCSCSCSRALSALPLALLLVVMLVLLALLLALLLLLLLLLVLLVLLGWWWLRSRLIEEEGAT